MLAEQYEKCELVKLDASALASGNLDEETTKELLD